jgi:glycosyltransferase involved in cell wall biosynthesis
MSFDRAASVKSRGISDIAYFNLPEVHPQLKCLWISRDIPFPQDAGDRIYSANIARSLAEAGASVCFLGYGLVMPKDFPEFWSSGWPIQTHALTSDKRGKLGALFNRLPIAAAIHATDEYRMLLDNQLSEPWDLIIIDSYGSGWALESCLAAKARAAAAGLAVPTLVYLSHNHEESIWRDMAAQRCANPLKRLALWQNARKVSALERRLVRDVDLVSAITEEDAQTYARQEPGKLTVTLTPGYSGRVAARRSFTASSPRHVVLVGSFRWVIKQENLRRFLALADARFKQHGIEFDVIGDVPQALLDEISPNLQATRFHGFVDDITPWFAAARMAVVPEVIGGGFKLKFLDYLFARIPIATISAAAAGLPQAIRDNMLGRDDLTQLVDAIIETMDQPERLNLMQEQAFNAAHELFDWKDRGLALRNAVEALRGNERSSRTASIRAGKATMPQQMQTALEARK